MMTAQDSNLLLDKTSIVKMKEMKKELHKEDKQKVMQES